LIKILLSSMPEIIKPKLLI